MILIASDERERTTDEVLDWLVSLGKAYFRLNESPFVAELSFSEQDVKLIFRNGTSVALSDFHCYWYRRGGMSCINQSNHDLSMVHEASKRLEAEFLSVAIQKELEAKPSLGSFFSSTPNKLHILRLAQSIGLTIPPFLVTNQKSELLQFKKQHEAIITKPIKDSITVNLKEGQVGCFTEELFDEDIAEINDTFFPTLFQKKIEKKYEIRSFFLEGKIYSMAIFSQNNKQTAVDFRKYDWAKPNRNVPFQLPQSVEEKIRKLMKAMKLNTGSLDFMVSKEGEYYFLEVNPVGQIGFVSAACNYFLEKEIALTLSQFAD